MNYTEVQLVDICDLQNGYAFKSADYVEKSNTLSCRMSNIRPDGTFDIEYNARYLPDSFAEKHNKFLLGDGDGDVVIAMTDLADSPKILGVPTVIQTKGRNILLNQRVGKLIIKDLNSVYFPYLQRVLNSPKTRSIYKRFAGGGLQINLGKKDLLSVKIPLPPLAEQQKIAAILDAADVLRQKDQQLIGHYTTLSQSLFLDMFGDPMTNPMGWEKKPLEQIGKVSTGNTPPSSKEDMFGGNIPFVTPSDLDTNKPYKRYVTNRGADNSRTVNANALLVCCIGATIGKTRMVKEFCAFNQQINAIQWEREINPLFGLYSFFFLKHEVIGRAISTTLPILKKSEFSKVQCTLPPITLQNQFAERIQHIEAQKQQAQASLEQSNNLFNSLLQKAFTGELTEEKES